MFISSVAFYMHMYTMYISKWRLEEAKTPSLKLQAHKFFSNDNMDISHKTKNVVN